MIIGFTCSTLQHAHALLMTSIHVGRIWPYILICLTFPSANWLQWAWFFSHSVFYFMIKADEFIILIIISKVPEDSRSSDIFNLQ